MGTSEYDLATPPSPDRDRGLWLQHLAGFILVEDVREYALSQVDPGLDAAARTAALKAIDDALYGVMMVLDGVSGGIWNSDYRVGFQTNICLKSNAPDSDVVIENLDLADGHGMCMGYHGWIVGDFGEDAIATPKTSAG